MKNIPTVPRFRSIVNLTRFLDNPLPIIKDALNTYGDTYMVYLGGTLRNIMTINPDVIQHILQKNHKNYIKSDITKKRLGKYLGRGLLTTDGAYWLRQRRLIQPGFHKAKLALLIQTMNDEITRYIANLEKRILKGQNIVNINNEMMELTLNIVCKTLFGSGMTQNQVQDFGKNVHKVQGYLVREIRSPIFNWWRKINGQERKAREISHAINETVMGFVRKRRDSGERHEDLLDMLIYSQYEDTGTFMEDKQIQDEALILFVAGHETSAVSTSWTFMLLSQHPEVRRLIVQELDETKDDQIPGFEDIPKLDYSRQVVSESMRLYSPAWIIDRLALEDDEVAGYKIPKGSMIAAFVHGVHRSEKYWSNPDQFDPSRFEKSKMKERHPFSYFPFGGGPRLCIGQHFALMEMQLIISRLSQKFNYTLVNPSIPEPKPLVTLRPEEDIMLRVELA
ncbi:MAG: cytochrome P450 [Bacteroidia bacterium]|nr:cytochrome P450 [Bacteroidia bacterium]